MKLTFTRIMVPACAVAFGLGTVAAALAADAVVGQKDKRFTTDAVTIAAGETVRWTNDDATGHLVISQSPNERFDLGVMKLGRFP